MGMLLSKPVLRLLAVILHRGEARRLVRLIQERHGEAAGGWLLPVDDTEAGDSDDAGATVATREWTESHPHCAHAHCSCTKNALRGLIDTFVLGYGAKAIMGLVLAIGSGSAFRSPKRIAIALGFDSIRFGAFLATFVGGFKGLQCALRYLRGTDDWVNAFVAGAASSSMGLLLDAPARRTTIALYLSTRAAEYVYTGMRRRGLVPTIPYADLLCMAICNAQICYAAIVEPDTHPRGYMDWIRHHGIQTKPQLDAARDIILSPSSAPFTPAAELIPPSMTPASFAALGKDARVCAVMHPEYPDDCAMAVSTFLRVGTPRNLKLYASLNLALGLIFKLRTAFTDPLTFGRNATVSTIRSTAFLTSYGIIGFCGLCFWRWLLPRGSHAVYYINGFVASLGILFEPSSRRHELVLYCIPRAIDSLYRSMVKRGTLPLIRRGEAIYFAFFMGCLMTTYQHERDLMRKNVRGLWEHLFGEN